MTTFTEILNSLDDLSTYRELKLFLLHEPKLVDPQSLSEEQVIEIYARLKENPKTVVLSQPYENSDLVRMENIYSVLDHASKRVTYYMEYGERYLKCIPSVYQHIIWKDYCVPAVGPVPVQVLFDYLLPIHGVVTTNHLQTDLGRGFWRFSVGTAHVKKMGVYYIDLNYNQKAIELNQWEAFRSLATFVAGQDKENEYRLLVIAQKHFSEELQMKFVYHPGPRFRPYQDPS